jgi:hypothetical protein
MYPNAWFQFPTNRCMENVLKRGQACPICREPDSGRPLRVSLVLRDCICKVFPNIYSLNTKKTLSTRDLLVEKFSSPEKMRNEIWFADTSLSLSARRAAVFRGACIAELQVGSAGPNDRGIIPEECLQRLLRRAGCLGEYREVYD